VTAITENIHNHRLEPQVISVCIFLLWVLVSAKTVMGVISGNLLGEPDIRDLGREDEGRREMVEKEV